MNLRLITVLLTLSCIHSFAQDIRCKVIDSTTGKPLTYATIIYSNNSKITYTDSLGYFLLEKDSVDVNDKVSIEFLGYDKRSFVIRELLSLNEIKLHQSTNVLAPVVVQSCKKLTQIVLNKRVGNIKQYVGPGPETRFIIIARYLNNKGRTGYIDNINLLMNETTSNFKVPIRLHWYEWDDVKRAPGKELTDTNLVMYATTKGWNNFSLPKNKIYFDFNNIVLGIEFIYPVEQIEQFRDLQTADQKLSWLQNMKNRWSLGLQQGETGDDGSFYIMNNDPIKKYGLPDQKVFYKPAVRFTVTTCKR